MPRRLIFFAILVIILVCLNWFREAAAQMATSLTDEQKAELLSKYAPTQATKSSNSTNYQTPPIYDDSGSVALVPEEPTADSTTSSKAPVIGLIPFDSLAPFGTELFSGPREVVPPSDIASAEDYVLGPGDNLIVSLWGQVEKEYVLTVDREGRVIIPKVGEIIAWGKELGDFRQELRGELSRLYQGFEMSVSLGKIRSIRVYLTGEVRKPGAYTVSSLTSLFNALYLAGGPNDNGSMRQIFLKRNGQSVAEVDLYKFLLQGDNSGDVRLESGDAIFIPVAGPRVAIRGKVRRPAIYELKGGQTAVDLLQLAGNAAADAYLGRVMLERIAGRDEWEVLDLNLSAAPDRPVDSVALLDGDRLTVFSVFEAKKNMVAVFGLVKHPGYFERNDSTRVSDLLERAKLQPYDVYYNRANLFRRHSDWRLEVIAVDLNKALQNDPVGNTLLTDGDSLHVYSISDVSWSKVVRIEGEVQRPGEYPLYDGMSVEDLIFLAGSYRRGASTLRAEIARYDSVGEVSLVEVRLTGGEAARTILKQDDRVYIRQIPQWELHRTVVMEGEVMYPGEYVLSGVDETLYQVLTRAGGFTPQAFPRGMVLERASIGTDLQRMQIPALLKRSSPVVQDSLGKLTRSELFEYDVQSMNRLVLDVDRLLASNGREGDVLLEPGDKIRVPRLPSGISVLGAVGASGTIGYQDNKKVKDYVKRAGGFTPVSDKGNVRLIKANGEVYSGGGALGRKVTLGDIVVVPTKVERQHSFGKTVSTALAATTSVLTTVLLITKL
jgi:polysaccharide export outer membrane protein